MSPRRVKLTLILAVLGASMLALLAWTQVWVNATVSTSGTDSLALAVDGSEASPAITALALAGFALAGALTIAGRIIRLVLGALEILIGVSVFLATYQVINAPALASSSAVTKATGIAGTESILAVVADASATPWPYLALVASFLMLLAGVGIIITAGRWPGPTSRYQTTRLAPAGGEMGNRDHAPDPVVDWDDLSRGEDPTAGNKRGRPLE
ncbi:hypothetical protein JF66_03165 [Cryobacterium sp. MLB-32]|uniref:Trp biosynthesis-associated membrane protein n=1 Tax=Cryobacterium sp. MLB-32 TaxID=1529318 RepID=UPI0004E77890|nr:Trp biosynthesis-associated membrane protein [Cryobacterium sp. MLB-32]KFF60594.1 hypothetical protein JF66_03165 [Cryobacterium sp. MLB-32]